MNEKQAKKRREHPLKAIRATGVPLVAYETTDPAATMLSCVDALGTRKDEIPIVEWNIVEGQRAHNDKALAIRKLFGDGADPLQEPSVFLAELAKLAREVTNESTKTTALDKALIFVFNFHLFARNEQVIQATWNLRDTFKAVGATLVLMQTGTTLPPELQNDVVIVSEVLPDEDELGAVVDGTLKDAGVKLDNERRARIVDTLLGLNSFCAEQALALSIGSGGVDLDALWERKRGMVQQTPGLSVWRGDEREADRLGGLAYAKDYFKRFLTSKRNPVRAILFLDEIEKLLGGAAGDLSGVAQDQLQVILTELQDNDIPAVLLIGPPGTGKTELGHYAAAIADAEFIKGDTGAMTGSLVGESQAKIRAAFRTFRAVAQGKAMVIATCNSISSLPPELRRRFAMGTFFCDIPDREERKAIWPIWMAKFGHDADTLQPDDDGWTGAEIKACCEIAHRMEMSLLEAAKNIVPISRSAGGRIESLRRSASGCFVDASKGGVYEHKSTAAPTGRKMEIVAVATAQAEMPEQE